MAEKLELLNAFLVKVFHIEFWENLPSGFSRDTRTETGIQP
jgi:hypothetical protein